MSGWEWQVEVVGIEKFQAVRLVCCGLGENGGG